MNTQEVKLLYDKLENVFYSIAEGILTGIVIGGIVADSNAKYPTIIIGIIMMLVAFSVSFYISVKNSKK